MDVEEEEENAKKVRSFQDQNQRATLPKSLPISKTRYLLYMFYM